MKRSRLPGTPDPEHYWQGHENNRIAADSWGDPTQQAVILMHGGGQTRHAWKGAGQTLAQAGFYAISLDLRGHGDSDWVEGAHYTDLEMVDDLVCVLAEQGIEQPVLVGASLGGMVALSAIGQGKVAAKALVLVDIAPQFTEDGAERVLSFMAQGTSGFDSLEAVAAAIESYQPHRKASRSLDGLANNVRLGEDGRYYWHWDPAFLKQPERSARNALRPRLYQYAEGLSLPTLLVRGGLSDILTEEGAQEFLQMCPHAQYTNVTDAAHMVAGDRNDLFTGAVVSFLAEL